MSIKIFGFSLGNPRTMRDPERVMHGDTPDRQRLQNIFLVGLALRIGGFGNFRAQVATDGVAENAEPLSDFPERNLVTKVPASDIPSNAALGDAGYQGVEKRPENLGKVVTCRVSMKRSKRKALPNNKLGRMREKLEHLKASVRAKVEHAFHVIKTCSGIARHDIAV